MHGAKGLRSCKNSGKSNEPIMGKTENTKIEVQANGPHFIGPLGERKLKCKKHGLPEEIFNNCSII